MTDYLTTPGYSITIPERIHIRDMAQKAAEVFGAECFIVNIGVAKGATLWCLREGAPLGRILGIDIDPKSDPGEWQFVHGDSRRVCADIEDPIHLLLVDGDHDYYGVRADIRNWTHKVARGGFVLFHDYGNAKEMPWTEGVQRAVDEGMGGVEWLEVGRADSIKAFERIGGECQQ